MMERQEILKRILDEREYQDQKWGTDFDDKNTVNDWGTYINHYVAKATQMNMSADAQEQAFLKVAALAVAAVESSGRNKGFPLRHYDRIA